MSREITRDPGRCPRCVRSFLSQTFLFPPVLIIKPSYFNSMDTGLKVIEFRSIKIEIIECLGQVKQKMAYTQDQS